MRHAWRRSDRTWRRPDSMGDTAAVTDAPRRSAAALSGGPRPAFAVLAALVIGLAAACGNATAPTAAPTLTAAPSIRAPASRAPSSSPSADPGIAAVKAFVALVSKKGFSYQASFTGQSRGSVDLLPLTGITQVSGTDVLVRVTFTFQTQRFPVEHRDVAGKAWIRYATGGWQRIPLAPADSMGAFADIHTAADVTYLGPITFGSASDYQVSFRSAIVNPVMIPFSNLTATTLTAPTLKLLIDAAGRPIKGTAAVNARGRISGQLQEIVIDLSVAFTKLGQAVTIKAP
jgi:hypothetical protein